MRTIPLLLAALTACSSDVAALRQEIAALREEVKLVTQPNAEAMAAMDDLGVEVRKLRERTAPPPPAPPPAPPVVLNAAQAGPLLGGVGGTQPGIADLYWVLARVAVGAEERTVLALYRASPKGFKLDAVRLLNYDLQMIEYQNDRPSVKTVKEEAERRK